MLVALIASTSSVAVPVAVSVGATAVFLVFAWSAVSLSRTAKELRDLADELSQHAASVLSDVERSAERAQAQLDRVDDLVGSAEAITETVGSAGRLAQAAVSGPLIKLMAFGAGTRRAGRRLRGEDAPRPARAAAQKQTGGRRLRRVG